MSTMRIAVAGTGGLACMIAHCISEETNHPVVLLSRAFRSLPIFTWLTITQDKPTLTARGFQILVIDYNDADDLKFALRGIDTIISTVTGQNQIHLIKAAVASRVRRFAPAEFEGPPQLRPSNDPLDRSRTSALNWLHHFRNNIEYTAFVCGVFYERFQPGGLPGTLIARNTGYHGEGAYMLDCARMSAEIPAYGPTNQPNVTICMTSVRDVAKFVTKAIDLPTWPNELRMSGERVNVQNLALLVQRLKNEKFQPYVLHTLHTLRAELALAAGQGDWGRGMRLQTLIATAEGRYDFSQRNLNQAFPGVQTERFEAFFIRKWDLQQAAE